MDEAHRRFAALMARRPVVLAPMEDVSDVPFRRLCRRLGADLVVTEFVRAELLVHGAPRAVRKIALDGDEAATAIQIYGANPDALVSAARIAGDAVPAFVDINCGCWVPRVAGRGAGAGWLREPEAMVAMAARVVAALPSLPVTVKTRIGWGPESHMPIVDLARHLEDAGVAALTVHCRTALQGHEGPADWQWARRAREVVSIPVIVNGDVRSADDVRRALDETGCAGVMIGRGAIDHPWIFREARALLDRGAHLPPPTADERRALYLQLVAGNVEKRGERFGVRVTRRHLRGIVGPIVDRATLAALFTAESVAQIEYLMSR